MKINRGPNDEKGWKKAKKELWKTIQKESIDFQKVPKKKKANTFGNFEEAIDKRIRKIEMEFSRIGKLCLGRKLLPDEKLRAHSDFLGLVNPLLDYWSKMQRKEEVWSGVPKKAGNMYKVP